MNRDSEEDRQALYEALYDEDCRRVAAERGCEVVVADDRTLQLDLDDAASYDHFWWMFERLTTEADPDDPVVLPVAYATPERPMPLTEWRSRSGIGRHVLVHLAEPLPVEQRIMLQCLLGSDPTREALNLLRHRKGVADPIRLFKPLVPATPPRNAEELWGDDLEF